MKIQSTNDITNPPVQKIVSQTDNKNINTLVSNAITSNKINPNSFFDNITIAKPSAKPNGFTVEFNKE